MRNAVLAVALLAAFATVAAALEIGDPAPPLKVKEWIVGGPVSPDKADGKTVFVVEFWATWCPPCRKTIPHLNSLHEKFKDKGVVIVGISDEDAATVRPFAKEMKMAYNVAVDDNRATYSVYMKGVEGIPHAFVIGRDGKVVWAGHPMGGLDGVLAQLVTGKYDTKKAEEVSQQEKAFRAAVERNDLEGALAASAKLVALEPLDYERFAMQVRLLRFKGDEDAIRAARREAAQRFAGSAELLNSLAWDIATDDSMTLQDLSLALDSAREATRIAEDRNANFLDTLARVYYGLCMIDEAIAAQDRAVKAAADDDERSRAEAVLAFYKTVKSLREKEASGRP